MIYVVFSFLKRHKTRSVIALVMLAVWLGIFKVHKENDVVLFNYNGEEISLFTSAKSWLRGDLEGGVTLVNVRRPKVKLPYHPASAPTIESVVSEIHRYDSDLKLIFHKSVNQHALVALFWNESKRLAALYSYPETDIYAEHETSAPDLKKVVSSPSPKIDIHRLTYLYEPEDGISSFIKQTGLEKHEIRGADLVTLKAEHGPLESWGFGTDSAPDNDASFTFFIGYDKSKQQWRTYEFRVQHVKTRSRRDWEMQEYNLR